MLPYAFADAHKYAYVTKVDGLYFWHTAPRLKEEPLPAVQSNKQDLLLDSNQPELDANILHACADLALCPKTLGVNFYV